MNSADEVLDEISRHELAWELIMGDSLTIKKYVNNQNDMQIPTTLKEAAEQNDVIAFLQIQRVKVDTDG